MSSLMLVVTFKTTLLLLTAFLVMAALPSASAALRHRLWALALLGVLALPVLEVSLPRLKIPVPSLLTEVSSHLESTTDKPLPEVDARLTQIQAVQPESKGAASQQQRPIDVASVTSAEPASAKRVLLVGLMAPALLYWISMAVGVIRLRAVCRRGREIATQSSLGKLFDRLEGELHLPKKVRLLSSDEVETPMAFGWFNPVIVVPGSACSWTSARLRDALIHELSHLSRGDWVYQSLAKLLCGLYWFNPLIWMASRRLMVDAERACDDAVLASGSLPTHYAQTLLEVAAESSRLRLPAMTMSRPHELATRIHSILDKDIRRNGMYFKEKIAVALVFGLFLMTLGASTLARENVTASEQLVVASSEGALEGAERALDDGAAVDAIHPLHGTALIQASLAGDTRLVELLIDRGADVEAEFRNRPHGSRTGGREIPRSALNAASREGHLEIVELLLEAGADPDRVPRGDASPLMIAAGSGHATLVELLLDAGADPNLKVRGDGTALLAAARSGSDEIVNALLDAGADPNQVVKGDGSALIAASKRANLDAVNALLDAGADPNLAVTGDGNPLLAAAASGNQDVVEDLIDRGADLDAGVRGDGNALIVAARKGDFEMVQTLVAKGAEVDRGVSGDGSALIVAAREGHFEIVEYLLDEGASVDLVVYGDENALINAASRGHLGIVELLVHAGADVQLAVPIARNSGKKRTALGRAKNFGHDEVVDFLLANGATEHES